jgi:hypothetical protein
MFIEQMGHRPFRHCRRGMEDYYEDYYKDGAASVVPTLVWRY